MCVRKGNEKDKKTGVSNVKVIDSFMYVRI